MTTICVVVHAEGAGDLGVASRQVPPGESLLEDERGPAHIIVERILTEGNKLPRGAIDFREPFRTRTGLRARGGMLLDRRNVDDILAGWLLRPAAIVIFLADSDDATPAERRQFLQTAIVANTLTGAVGIAVREFEAWLIADGAAISKVLGISPSCPKNPEQLPCQKAKELLKSWTKESLTPNRNALDVRKDLASAIDLDVVARACDSFAAFRRDVGQLMEQKP